jgi:hypothetical protein
LLSERREVMMLSSRFLSSTPVKGVPTTCFIIHLYRLAVFGRS